MRADTRRLIWGVLSVAAILAIFVIGRTAISTDSSVLGQILGQADPVLGGLLTFGIFILGAFLGIPQWLLIGGAVLAFGPAMGAGLSWVSTLVSAQIGYEIGLGLGEARIRERAGPRMSVWLDRIYRHGLWAAVLIRLVPTGPFVMVNMAAGASGLDRRNFALGTAVGIVPKIGAIAFFGGSVLEMMMDAGSVRAVAMILAGLGLVVFLAWMRRRTKAKL